MCAVTKEERESIEQLLEPNSKILCIAFSQIFRWVDTIRMVFVSEAKGALCLVKSYNDKAYYFRLYCLKYQEVLWEQKLHATMIYEEERPVVHTFSLRGFLIACNFYDKREAKDMYNNVFRVIKKMKEDMNTLSLSNVTKSQNNIAVPNKDVSSQETSAKEQHQSVNNLLSPLKLNLKGLTGIKLGEKLTQDTRSDCIGGRLSFAVEVQEDFQANTENENNSTNNQSRIVSQYEALLQNNAEIFPNSLNLANSISSGPRKVKLTKDDVGSPTDFKHFVHIEWMDEKKKIV